MGTAVHHIALACRDAEETHQFYGELLGFPLVHTEIQGQGPSWVRHFFYDLGDGSCLAFFELNQVGEPENFDPAISTGLGLPIWVNHLAVRRDLDEITELRNRLEEAGVKPEMELDHGWCTSTYYRDPNGTLIEFCADSPGFTPEPEEALRLLREDPATVVAPGS